MSLCDCCNGEISRGDGYAVWSEIEIGGIEVGAMLFCKKCADRLFTDQVWEDATKQHTRKKHWKTVNKIHLRCQSPQPDDLMKIRRAHDCWIAARAKVRGLSPKRAKSEARKIAKIWWVDQNEAVRRMAFPRYKPGEIAKMEEEFGQERIWNRRLKILHRKSGRPCKISGIF